MTSSSSTTTAAPSQPSTMQDLRETCSMLWQQHKQGNIHWIILIYMTLVHIGAVAAIFKAFESKKETLIFAFLLWPLTGFGITAGVHRLWSHRSYEAGLPLRIFLMLCNSIANQYSIYHWARDHRVHHKFSETDADPHNAKRGFFFAHMGWLFLTKHPETLKAGREMDFSDLLEDPVVYFQKKLDPWFALVMCFLMPAQVASYFWGESFWNAFLIAGVFRYCFVLHCTWLVNSAAHFYGDHPYDVHSYPAENPIVSWFAIGEGWHNWHHKYPFDYAASEFGISSQYNPTKLFIDICSATGLAWGCKRATTVWQLGRIRRDKARESGVPAPQPLQRPQKEMAAGSKKDT